ncbi:hypothetical protein PUNSTDRAFT_51607 [Punctularia strigosozonata HHB-11173 SS5]|uniref:uncharacterized protein n=1 Tax=Punctularia strigosozonata (strain HHB-11173) TaxID=741275 RepID=UPI00044175B0|nr:uncharacterized protein PUNSTDRAFT_51607 [Punctularia strigosozonata HHB-11173 SS5]EIN11037.1 hypothetical protein PUNSTDRAFT_51607 [Punctularia strigosozonata HHB-11173 SS5]
MPGQQGYFAQPNTGLQFFPQGQQAGVQPQVIPAQTVVQTQKPFQFQPPLFQPQPQMQPQPQPQPHPQPGPSLAQRVATPFHPGMTSNLQPPHVAAGNPLPQPPYYNLPGMPTPLPPPPQGVYGPPGPRPRTPLRNPLPDPPRDLYELEPYRTLTKDLQSLWAYPWRTEQLDADGARSGHQRSRSDGGGGLFSSWGRSKSKEKKPKKNSKRGGLFRSMTTGGSAGQAPIPTRGRQRRPDIPRSLMALISGAENQVGTDAQVYVMTTPGPGASAQPAGAATASPVAGMNLQNTAASGGTPGANPALSPMTLFRSPGPARTPLMPASAQPTPGPYSPALGGMQQFGMPQPQTDERPITFSSQDAPEYSGFLLSSPHRILYKDVLWPTAYHLLEAMRFMHDSGDPAPLKELQERVRLCQTIGEVQAFVTGGAQWQRPDWNDVVMDKVDEVLYLKFTQHPELGNLLLSTGNRELVYTEFSDGFWSAGAQTANRLGLALMRVRERMRN